MGPAWGRCGDLASWAQRAMGRLWVETRHGKGQTTEEQAFSLVGKQETVYAVVSHRASEDARFIANGLLRSWWELGII